MIVLEHDDELHELLCEAIRALVEHDRETALRLDLARRELLAELDELPAARDDMN